MTLQALDVTQRHVLVVDDDADFREIVAATLARQGMRVSQAASFDEAFGACVDQVPDLILMDVQMPGRSGLQGCMTFRQSDRTAETPIILMSAHWRDEQQLVRAFDCGAADVLSKTNGSHELMARIRSVLALSSVRQQLALGEGDPASLRDFLAVCAACKRVKEEGAGWQDTERYLKRVTGHEITHGVCSDCRDRLYGSHGSPVDGDGPGPGEGTT